MRKPRSELRALLSLHLLLLLAPGTARPAARIHGCLFDERLCSAQERCVIDGLFGHCQDALLPVRTEYDVSPAVLGRLREVLRQLLLQGLSWQDDITQYVIAMEMEKVPKLHPQQQQLSTVMGDERFPLPTGKGQRPASVPLEQWPATEIIRYLKFILYGSKPELSLGHGVNRDLVGPYPIGKSGNVLDLRGEEERSPQRRAGLDGVNDPDYPSDHGNRYWPTYDDSQDQRLKYPNRIKDINVGSNTPRPQAAAEDLGGLLQKKASALDGHRQQRKGVESRIMDTPPPNRAGAWSQEWRAGKEVGSAGNREASGRRVQAAAVELGLSQEEVDLPPKGFPKAGEGHQPEWAPTAASPNKEEYAYIVTDKKPLTLSDGIKLLESLALRLHLATVNFINISVIGPALTFRLRHNDHNLTVEEVASKAVADKADLEAETGLKIIQAGVGERNTFHLLPKPARHSDTFRFLLLTFIAVACIAGILIAGAVIFCLRQNAKQRQKEKLAGMGGEGATDTSLEYQELCRQHMAAKSSYSRTETVDTSRVSSVSSQFSDAPQASPSSHSSTPSWCEEPVQSNMDISTGHMILSYMEDHLKIKDRLHKEWEALCAYQAEPNACSIAQSEANIKKCRNPTFVPYDHNRMVLKAEVNPSRTDFINASPIIDHDPRMPAYIATQGPLSHTIPDFWQMVWENGCTVIVMLTPLVEDSVRHCDRYWPDEGSSLYHIYEVNLVSEHIWCEDFLVRSFYLKNLQSQETRTLTQFHFLSWPAEGIPSSTRPLLDFRRKVNKCYRGRSCPIIVHCSDGVGRTGTYTLIDMVLNRMSKGVKEIDIAATLEHIRDQRPGMVCTKDQFEFALTAVAEEVNAILKALPQ
ncbi:receptor-type tyrosine-protein phosphatase-like N [Pristis pectinata]|uniref:receptor-type tyrosine-protein phosphatase-like N n=1 Tax=Pristis pectinata TaxID=685728 RepID=UPI00223DBD40|nr:receptor-type tyrosine-protein phosphatase-like N [Pristis pectinata]